MLRKLNNTINLIIILAVAYLSFLSLKPFNTKTNTVTHDGFQVERAIGHLKKISEKPHYSGSVEHEKVRNYIAKELRNLGLQVRIQQTKITSKNTYIQVNNIIARIKGSDSDSKSLVLMSHYDSVPYASLGAGDAGSGVAVILEGLRAYLEQNIVPKNDIIVLITDAEELGLLGAKAFVNKHPWADYVGAVLNFEARGSSGSSYMLMETNGGNHNLLNHYKSANNPYPNSNSLSYSIYKMLPNDTDLTIFRRDKGIVGFNFAFIGDHFNYHTKLDNTENLSLNSLAHQANYLMPMLNHLSQIDLTQLKSKQDDVYFQIPFFKTINYPFDLALIMSIANLIFFILIVVYGIKKQSLQIKSVFSSSLPLFKTITSTVLVCFLVLKFLYWLHPQYTEILHGFTYNGYWYIVFFSIITIAITYLFYKDIDQKINTSNTLVIPVLIWIMIDFLMAIFLTGAHYFILISFSGSLILLAKIIYNNKYPILTLLLTAPAILIFSPMFMQFPVALGLAIIPFSSILLVLFISVFISNITYPEKSDVNKWVFLAPLLAIYLLAETKASYNPKRPLPDSLFYFQDNTNSSAFMFTQDNKTDNWNKEFFVNKLLNDEQLTHFKKNNWRRAKIVAPTDNRNIQVANVEISKNSNHANNQHYQIKVTPQRNTHVLILKTNNEINLSKLSINNEAIATKTSKTLKTGDAIARIFNNGESYFDLDIEIKNNQTLDLTLIEMSPDLLQSKLLDIPERSDEFMPKPFIYTDSIITKQRIF